MEGYFSERGLLDRWIEAAVWQRLRDKLQPVNEKGQYDPKQARGRLEDALASLVDEQSEDILEGWLTVAFELTLPEELGPVEDQCRCRWCERAWQRQQQEAQTPEGRPCPGTCS